MMVKQARKGKSMPKLLDSRFGHWMNYQMAVRAARKATRASIAQRYDAAHSNLLQLLETVRAGEWALPTAYPDGRALTMEGDHPLLGALRAEVMANAVQVPSAVTDRLCTVAQRVQVNVAIGVIERADADDEATYYNTLLFIDAQGRLVGRYRTPCVSAVTSPKWIPAATGRPTNETPALTGVGGI